MVKLNSEVQSVVRQFKDRHSGKPLWDGPCAGTPNGGVTYSMLSRFIVCRERFRCYALEGLRPADEWNHKIEFGNMWHTVEEAYARTGTVTRTPSGMLCCKELDAYCVALMQKMPYRREEIDHWCRVCKVQFPLYADHWEHHADVTSRKPVCQEEVFDVPYHLPSGRRVRLRGKFDSVDLIGKGKAQGLYLQENKSKGTVDEPALKRQLRYNLQTMIYLVALRRWTDYPEEMLRGVRYNVVRRPLSGGKGSIVRKKPTKGAKCKKCNGTGKVVPGGSGRFDPWAATCQKCKGVGRKGAKPGETLEEYYGRLGAIIKENPKEFFFRWKVEVSLTDLEEFERDCLIPLLEQLCVWYEWIANKNVVSIHPQYLHWRHPYGIWNIIDDGGETELDGYLETKSETGLRRVDKLFEELL